MFHKIITLTTTFAVALHIMLGCCLHHAHGCDSQEAVTSDSASMGQIGLCSHGHHDHSHSGKGTAPYESNGNHDHDEGPCDEGDCSFTFVQLSDDFDQVLTLAVWTLTIGDIANATTLDGMLAYSIAAETLPCPNSSDSARSNSQVWNL